MALLWHDLTLPEESAAALQAARPVAAEWDGLRVPEVSAAAGA